MKQDKLFKYVDNLFHLDKDEFWKQIKRMERLNQSVNIKVDQLKKEYEKTFNESYCTEDDVKKAKEKFDSFLKKHSKKKFKYKIDEQILQGMVNELNKGKSVGLRGLSNEM